MNRQHERAKGVGEGLATAGGSGERPGCGSVSRPSRPILAILLLLALAWVVLAWGAWPAAEAAGQDNTVFRATLENGLEVIVVRNPLAPVVTTVLNYQVGSNEAPEGFPGTAHAQEHMMFRGSPGLSANQLADITAAMGGMFDADTQQMVTQYFFTVPSEDLDVALHIEAIRMRGVLDTEKLWSKERGAIEQEVSRDYSSPEYIFYTKLLADMFKGTVYAQDALGTIPSFDKTTGPMLKKFHETWYVPNNAILVMVGDVEPQGALDLVKKFFAGIPAKDLPKRPEIQLQPVKPETINLKSDQGFGLVMVAFRMPGYTSPDYAASQVLADVLSNQRSSLYALVPAGKALYTTFTLTTLPQSGLGYVVAAFPKGSDPAALVDEIKKVLAEDLKNGFPTDLVEAAKRQEVTGAELQKNSIFGLAMAWSQAVAVEGRASPEDDVEAIQGVTAADVNRVARKYLDDAVIGILTPEASGQPVSGKGFGGVESFTPKGAERVRLPEWAEKALKRLAVPPSTIHPVVTDLPNGLKLIVQHEPISKTVSVYGHILNNPDLEAPAGQEGIDQVLEQLFSYGTESLDRLAFQKALDEIGANESAGSDFSLQVLKEHFDRGVELLADNQLRPALPEYGFKTVQQQIAATVAGQLQSPGYLASRAVDEGLYPKGDPSLRQPTPETVSSLTLQDVKDYYGKAFRPDLTTIVVIGDVTPEEAKTVVQKHFGSWAAGGGLKPQVFLPSVPLNKPSTVAVPDASRMQDKVHLAETLGLDRSNPDYYALELGNHVLGGGFYATRLYQDLREETGLVYYVSSSFDMTRTRGAYSVEYGCDPGNVSKVHAIVRQNLKEMQDTPVTAEELHQAKAMLLRHIPLSESSVDSIADGFLSRVALGLPLDEPSRTAHRYVKLTAEQVRAAFAKWIRPADLVQVSQGPSP
jgi:zinc protease